MIERHPAAGWGGQVQEYLVSVHAQDAEDAVARVRAAVERYGHYSGFASAAR